MALFGPYTPPGNSAISGGITESGFGACPGGAASWILDGNNCVTINHFFAEQKARLLDWSAAVTGGYLITRVKVRVKGSDPAGTLKARLYHSSSPVGDIKTFALPGVYDKTFDHEVNALGSGWNVAGITVAIVNGAGFGIALSWTAPGALDLLDGVSIEIEADAPPPPDPAEIALHTALSAYGALTALVGIRIYETHYPPAENRVAVTGAAFPLVLYRRIDTGFSQAITGEILGSSPRFQVQAVSDDLQETQEVALEIYDALVSAIGIFEDVTILSDRQQPKPEANLFKRIIEAEVLQVGVS